VEHHDHHHALSPRGHAKYDSFTPHIPHEVGGGDVDHHEHGRPKHKKYNTFTQHDPQHHHHHEKKSKKKKKKKHKSKKQYCFFFSKRSTSKEPFTNLVSCEFSSKNKTFTKLSFLIFVRART
jgi:hypothetical protein